MNIINQINNSNIPWKIISELTIEELEKVIKLSSYYYYNTDTILISDEIYDILIDNLKKLNPKSELLKKVGSKEKNTKTKLPYWMGSMNKINSDNETLKKWIDKYKGEYIISDKLDGVSCLFYYNNKNLKLYTRGDGNYGRDISYLINMINIPKFKIDKNKIAIRGELIMSKKNFKKYIGQKENARSMVTGIVNSKKNSINKNEAFDIDFIVYEIIDPIYLPSEQLKILKKWNFNIIYYDIYNNINFDILNNILIKRKKKSIYEIDGIIITNNQKYVRNIEGNPDYSFAFKGISKTAEVKVIDVLWKPSKDGYLIPRVKFEKIKLSQATLEYAHGFTAKYIQNNGIGPGAIITIIRSGDVIPYIINIVKKAKNISWPEQYQYKWDKNNVHLVLLNIDKNKTVIIQRLTKFVNVLKVNNLSEGIITKLVNNGFDTIFKLINIKLDDLLKIEGFKEVLAKKIYNNLKKKLLNIDLLTLMDASNIFGRGISKKKIKKILDIYPNIVNEYNFLEKKKWCQKIINIDGFDILTTEKFLNGLKNFQIFYKKIKTKIKITKYQKKIIKNGRFNDMIIVFTGFRNDKWVEIIENEGGSISDNITKNTTLLVYNDGEEFSNKYKKAQKLNIKMISKNMFKKNYNLE